MKFFLGAFCALSVLTTRILCDVELAFYDDDLNHEVQDFSIKFPSSGSDDIQTLRIVKDGRVIIEKSIYEIGEGLELEIEGKYLDPGENKLEVLFVSAAGEIVERNILSVFSPPTIRPAGDEDDISSMETGRISIHTSIFDSIFNGVSSSRQRAMAVGVGVLGAGVLGAGATSYRVPKPFKLAHPKSTSTAENPIYPLVKINNPVTGIKTQQSATVGAGTRPPLRPLASDVRTTPPVLTRYVAPTSTGDKIRTTLMSQYDRLPQGTREAAGIVLGGGTMILGAQLGRMIASRLLGSKQKSKKQDDNRAMATHTSTRPWGMSYLRPVLNRGNMRRRRGMRL